MHTSQSLRSHSALKIPVWEAIIINTEYVPLSWIIFVSLHNNLSLELSQKWPQSLFAPSPDSRHRTEEGLNVPQLDPWPCLTNRTLLLVILPICFGEIFYCSSSSTLKVWPITWNETFTGDRTCVSCSIPSQKCVTVNTLNIQKYPMQSSINALCTLHIYLHGMGDVARRERLVRDLFNVLLFIQNLFRIVNRYKCIKRTRRKYF